MWKALRISPSEGVQDTITTSSVHDWFGMLPQSILSIAGKDVPGLGADIDASNWSTDTPRGEMPTGTTSKFKDGCPRNPRVYQVFWYIM